MDVKEVKKLLDAVTAADVDEFRYETADVRIEVKRNGVSAAAPAPVAVAPAAAPAPAPAVASAPAAGDAAPAPEAEEPSDGLVDVKAPIVGTFYAAPAPDAEPFVKVGDRVEAGAVLCILEAMKLMNEIEAEVAGTVREVLVRNEEPVEYGQVLVRIAPD